MQSSMKKLKEVDFTDSKDKMDDQDDELSEHLLDFEQSLETMLNLETESKLDLTKLNNRRYINPQFSSGFSGGLRNDGYIKIGSLEGSLKDSIEIGKEEDADIKTEETSSKELISYFAHLGRPDNTDVVDYAFLDTLLTLADVNSRDIHGQTVLHEVAREWHPDLAFFFKVKGFDIDMEDNWGRTPLFVAVASNYTEMITWLIDNGADINHRTIKGEGQTPIHFAAKYDAVDAFKLLLTKGANPLMKDEQSRDPFFLAAQAGNTRVCRYMLDLELPTACYANSGEATIDHIIENLPLDYAETALNQYIVKDKTSGHIKLYLSCLGKRRWRLLLNKQRENNPIPLFAGVTPPNPLEIITRRGILKLVNHPVMLNLIKLKYKKVGKKLIQLNIFLHILFTLLWTVSISIKTPLIVNTINVDGFSQEHNAILGLTLIAQALTFLFIHKLIREYTSLVRITEDERKRLLIQYKKGKQFCHPRWRMDMSMLLKVKDKAKAMCTDFWLNGWQIIEFICLLMATVNTIITITWYVNMKLYRQSVLPEVRMYYSAIFVIIVWLRLNRAFRSHRHFGPFVAMLSQCAICSVKIGFLFFEFFIPLTVTCWVLFGGDRKLRKKTAQEVAALSVEYEKIQDLIYQLYLLSFGGDYEYNTLKKIDKTASQIFVGGYFLLLTIITINIYIALLSEAASRIIATAVERADLEESDSCGKVERTFPNLKREFEIYLERHCSPLEIQSADFKQTRTFNSRKVVTETSEIIMSLSESVNGIIQEQTCAKKDLQLLQETLEDFQEKYSKENVQCTVKRISSMIGFQMRPYVKVAKKTDDSIMKYINRIKENMM